MGRLTHWGETSYVTFQCWQTELEKRRNFRASLFDALLLLLKVKATIAELLKLEGTLRPH